MAFKDWTSLISEEELDAQIAKAKAATEEADKLEPRAISVKFYRSSSLVVVSLRNGVIFGFPTSLIQGLEEASFDDLENVWLNASGSSIHWDRLDVDLSITSLVSGVFGTKAWMAKIQGKEVSIITSDDKSDRPQRLFQETVA